MAEVPRTILLVEAESAAATALASALEAAGYSVLRARSGEASSDLSIARLLESESKFRNIFDNCEVGIFRTRIDGSEVLDVNRKYLEIVGLPRDQVVGKPSVMRWADPREHEDMLRRLRDEGEVANLEFRGVNGRGEILHCLTSVKAYPDQGTLEGSIQDITERKSIESQLMRSNKLLSNAMAIGNIAWWEMDVLTGAISFHENKARMLGYEPEAFRDYRDFTALLHPDDLERAMGAMRDHLEGREESYSVEYRIKTAAGGWRWFSDLGRISEFDGAGKPSKVLGIVTDATGRRAEEDKLLDRIRIYHALFEMNGAVKLLIDPESGAIVDANPAASRFYGYSEARLKGMNISDINTAPPAEIGNEMLKATKEIRDQFLFRHRLADGSVRDVEVFANPIEIAGKTFLHSIVHDITERKRDEERIHKLLEEKELLLKEVHHRVKNNMNTVVSLLSLQADACGEENAGVGRDASRILKDAMARVEIMSVLYDKIYRSDIVDALPLGDYLPDLAREIVAIFGQAGRVEVVARIEELTIGVKILTPIGIIVNELITNSLKYAFARTERPVISISASRTGGRIALAYEDNGAGLPAGFSLDSSKGFGMRLLKSLAGQIDGSISVGTGRGALFIVEFPA